MRSNN